MTTQKPIDLDAELGFETVDIKTVPIKLYGREWDLIQSVNSFSISALMAGGADAISRYMTNSVVESQRIDFANTLAGDPDLDEDKLLKIFKVLVEVASGRPTNKPAPNSRPASKRTSSPKSAAR